jgi:hypothetical protein
MKDIFETILVERAAIVIAGGRHLEGISGQSAYKSPFLMATQSVMEAHPSSSGLPEPPKQADVASISKTSAEKPLFLPKAEGAKSWSHEVPSINFLRSIASAGLSNDHWLLLSSSQTRTAASAVTVRRQSVELLDIAKGCHTAHTRGDCGKT